MKQKQFNEELFTFLKNGTTAFTVIETLKKEYLEKGFQELEETDIWELSEGNYFTIRNDATFIAFHIPKKYNSQFLITTTHCDTPSLLLKPNGENVKNGYLKYNVMPYGGLLNYGWLDRPLSLAGRIIMEKDHEFTSKIIDLKEPFCIIPSVAVHQNDKANSSLDLNMQTDLQPIFSLTEKKESLISYLEKTLHLSHKIKDFDLFLYNTESPQIVGLEKNILISPRIDNLTSTFAASKAFLENKNQAINVFVTFNNEEIGSLTKEGAESSFLLDILKRIASSLKLDLAKTLANTFIISSDNTHAIHPNHAEYMDETGNPNLNKGIAIIKEVTSTTDGYFSSLFKEICQKAQVPYQDTTTKNDIVSGSTLSGLSLRHVSVASIDIGIPQLAMHSSYECCGLNDIFFLYQALNQFYHTDIILQKKKTKLIFY